jgi:glutamine synthetase adenylyltransferase
MISNSNSNLSNTNCNVNEYIRNLLSNMKPEERNTMLASIEAEEQKEKEELAKNPNLPLERKLSSILDELKNLRCEIKYQHNQYQHHPCYNYITPKTVEHEVLDDNISETSITSLFCGDWWPYFWYFVILIFLIIITPSPSTRPLTSRPFSL